MTPDTALFSPAPVRWTALQGIGRACILSLFVLFLAGCATTPRIDWQARVGTYTFDQAVLELGPPTNSATLSDGTRVAEWLLYRGYRGGAYTTFGGPYYFGGPFVYHYAEPPSPDRLLRLTFGPDGILRNWQYVTR